MKFHQALFMASLIAGLTAGLGCSGTTPTGSTSSGGTANEGGKTITSIDITPGKDPLRSGASQQFRAVAHFDDGTSEDITNSKDVKWSTSASTLATVTNSGMVTATKTGPVDITVEYKGERGEKHVIIVA
jgi:uncharacterized protein YjdB